MPKRSSKWITTTRRPPSARLRGIPAPHIRTSLSPDSILRRRARARRRRTTASDIIEISSDSDLEALPPPFLRRRSREIIDLTHLPSTPPPDPQPRRMLDVDDNVAPHSRRSTPPRQTSPAQSASRPTWLRAALGELHSAYDGVRLVRLFSEIGANPHMPSSWLMKCQECGDDKTMIIPAGPGRTLESFVQHIVTVHPRSLKSLSCFNWLLTIYVCPVSGVVGQ